ncbi:hypothetical protein C7S14_2891 [Burkholderia cepacia]|nr:hypothetical protein C7S14_2891 [Burkholderia cepacia]
MLQTRGVSRSRHVGTRSTGSSPRQSRHIARLSDAERMRKDRFHYIPSLSYTYLFDVFHQPN